MRIEDGELDGAKEETEKALPVKLQEEKKKKNVARVKVDIAIDISANAPRTDCKVKKSMSGYCLFLGSRLISQSLCES
jgi:hypothetical protein